MTRTLRQRNFGLNNEADALNLYDPSDTVVDATSWTVAAPGIEDPNSWSRVPDGTGAFAVTTATQDGAN